MKLPSCACVGQNAHLGKIQEILRGTVFIRATQTIDSYSKNTALTVGFASGRCLYAYVGNNPINANDPSGLMGNGASGTYSKVSPINKGSGQPAADYISVGVSGVPIVSFELTLSGSGKVYFGTGTGNVTVDPGIQLSVGRLVGAHTQKEVDEFIFGGGAKLDSPRPLGVGYSAVFSGSKMANQINLGTPSWLPGGGGGYAAPVFDLAPDRPRGVPIPAQEQRVSNQYKPQGLIGSTETSFRPSYPSISAGSFIGRVYGKP